MTWDTKNIDLQNLINLSRGDRLVVYKYLNQFLELIPLKIDKLKTSLQEEDRLVIRKTLHQVSPQLHFFGVPDVVEPIRRLEVEYESIQMVKLRALVNTIIIKLERAVEEIKTILKNNF